MSARIHCLTLSSFVCGLMLAHAPVTAQQPAPQPQQFTQPQPVGQAQPGQPQYQQPQYQQPGVAPQAPLAGPPGALAPVPQPAAPQPLATAPFQLSPQDEASLDRLLTDWQNMSGNVKTFEARFDRFDWNAVFGNAGAPTKIVQGSLKYSAPDKGFYELDDKSEKWICTGDAVFEFRAVDKKVREHRLPPNLRGQAISDGPMPFVFGVQAAKMKARYWLRINTPQNSESNQVWLEAYPRHAQDAANFLKVDIILAFEHKNGTVTKLEPYAINIVDPNGKDRKAYRFTEMKANGTLANLQEFFRIFVTPSVPFGWQHELVDDGAQAGPPNAQPTQPLQPTPGGAPLPPQGGIGSAPQPTVPR